MSILLISIKIIAIILAVFLILLLLCLFHPVFYRVQGEIVEMPKPVLQGHFWWLFQILRVEFKLNEGDVSVKLRILGIGKKLHKKKPGEETDDSSVEENPGEEANDGSVGKIPGEETDEKSVGESPGEKTGKSAETTSTKEEKTKGKRKKKKRDKQGKSRDKDHKTKEKGKMKSFFSTAKKEIADEKNKLAVVHAWRELLYLLSHLKPKYARGEIHFSTGDPALTGELTGVLSLLPVIYRYGLHAYPDFTADAFYVKGNLELKGRMSLYHMVLVIIRLLGDKNFRRLIKKIRK